MVLLLLLLLLAAAAASVSSVPAFTAVYSHMILG
jgi:hypothetical protein